jgi:hypothetical protein
MSDEATAEKTVSRKRGLVRTAIEVGLALSGIACMVVMCMGGPVVWWFAGLTLFCTGLALDPDSFC